MLNKQLCVMLSPDHHKKLKILSATKGITMQELAKRAIDSLIIRTEIEHRDWPGQVVVKVNYTDTSDNTAPADR